MHKSLVVMTVIFGLIGGGMLIGAGFAAKSTLDAKANAVFAEGKVVELDSYRDSDGDTLYKPVVEYTDANGATHRITGSVGSSPAAFDVGETVSVFHPPGQPEQARIDGFTENWLLPTVFGGFGLIFGGIAGGFIGYAIHRSRLRKWLQSNGMRVQAHFTGVEYDTSLKVNGRSPWRLTAQWQHPVSKEIHSFRSEAIWFDPTPYCERETIEVLVDADRPKRHHIDTSFLPVHAG